MSVDIRTRLTKRLAELEAEAQQIVEDLSLLSNLERKYENLQSNGNGSASSQVEMTSKSFVDITLDEAIYEIMDSAHGGELRAKEIAERLLRGGYQTRSPLNNFVQGVGFRLGKLAVKGTIKKVGTGLYRSKET